MPPDTLDPARLLADLRWLSRLACALVADPALADDACHDAWLRARCSAGHDAPDRSCLARSLRNVLWSARRGHARRLERERLAAQPESLPSTDELIASGEQQRLVWDELLRLDEPFRTTLLLRFQEGLEPALIADRLGVPRDTTRWRLRRGLELLRVRLAGSEGRQWRARLLAALPASILPEVALDVSVPVAVGSLGMGAVGMVKTIGACALCLVALLVGRGLLGSTALEPALRVGADGSAPPPTTGTPAAPLVASDLDAPTVVRTVEPARAPLAPAARESDCRVVGRVVDPAGEPLAGAALRAGVYGGWERETQSVADGTFTLVCPVQQADVVELEIDPGRYHALRRLKLGTAPECNEGALLGGPRDLGDIELAACGAIEGRVTDEAGEPVAGASIWLRGAGGRSHPGTRARIETLEDGRFLVPSVLPGSCVVVASLRGYLDASGAVEVQAARTSSGIDLILPHAKLVTGVVVDASDRPIPGARVSSNGFIRGWVTTAGPDGRFEIGLPTTEPGEISASARGFLQGGHASCAPGEQDVRVRLGSAGERCHLLVVDDARGDLILRFGVRIARGAGADFGDERAGSGGGRPPTSASRAEGRVAFLGRPGKDRFDIAAPGYMRVQGEIEPDSTIEAPQVVRLLRAPGITGRILEAGEPVEGARVVLVGGMLGRVRNIVDAEGSRAAGVDPRDPMAMGSVTGGFQMYDVFALDSDPRRFSFEVWGRSRTATTGADGRFLFENLDGDCYGLRVAHGESVRLILGPVGTPPRERVDLGDLRLEAAGVITGTLVPSIATPLDGHTVGIANLPGLVAQTDAEGTFQLAGVPPGDIILNVSSGGGFAIAPGSPTRYALRLAPGQHRTVELPVSADEVCQVSIRMLVDGAVEPELDVDLRSLDKDGATHVTLEPCGARSGRYEGTVPARGALGIRVQAETWSFELEEPLHPTPGGSLERELHVETGVLEVVLDAATEVTPEGRFVLLRNAPDGRPLATHALRGEDVTRGEAEARLLRYRLPVGAHDVRIRSRRGVFAEEDPDFGIDGHVVIRPGEVTRIGE
ncbi:MAG: hypothetical protein GY711_24960 [bacterium]|nr:hypothetical protein [bacterium]